MAIIFCNDLQVRNYKDTQINKTAERKIYIILI